MNIYKKFTKDVGLMGFLSMIGQLRGLILLPILAKEIGPANYGIWSQANVTIELLIPVALLGLNGAFIRFLAAEKDRKILREGIYSTLFAVILMSTILSLIVFLFASEIASALFGGAEAAIVVKIISGILIIWSIDKIFLTFFRTFRKMKFFTGTSIAINFGEIGLIAYLVFAGYGVAGIVFSLLFVRLIVGIFMAYIVISTVGFKFPDFSFIRTYLNYSLPTIPTAFFWWMVMSSDRYIIGYFLGTAPVGIYSAAYGIGSIGLIFMEPIKLVLVPALSKLWDEQKITEVKVHLKYSAKYFFMLAIPSSFGISVLSKPILYILTTSEFIPEGIFVIPLASLCILIYGIYPIVGQVLFLVKKTKLIGSIWMMAALINVLLNLILIPIIGIVGAVVATLISFLLASTVTIFYANKYLKVDFDLNFITKSIVASMIMSIIVSVMTPIGVIELLVSICFGAIIYFILLILMKGFKDEEIKFFIDLYKMIHSRP